MISELITSAWLVVKTETVYSELFLKTNEN